MRLDKSRARCIGIWAAVLTVTIVPVIVASVSPLHEWRSPVYITAGFAGIVGMSLLLFQPLLVGGLLPGLSLLLSRRIHRAVGIALVFAVVIHVIGLWITSPPDVIDALLFVSATPFSVWGVVAMWSVIISALLVLFRRKWRARMRVWRFSHQALAVLVVVGSVVHAMMIEGTMGAMSKTILCICVVLISALVLVKQFLRTL